MCAKRILTTVLLGLRRSQQPNLKTLEKENHVKLSNIMLKKINGRLVIPLQEEFQFTILKPVRENTKDKSSRKDKNYPIRNPDSNKQLIKSAVRLTDM